MEPLQLRLPAEPDSASKARDSVLAWSQYLDPESLGDVRTVVSELVALSVKHGDSGPIDLRPELDQAEIKGSILDSTADSVAAASESASFALRIIDGMVDEWRTDQERRAVWFRMSVAG